MMQNANINLVLCQLARPSANNPVYAIGLEPAGLFHQYPFRAPPDLHQILTPHLEQRNVINATPKYSLVDLHIDYGIDGISSAFDGCRKLWLMFPPIERNLELMRIERDETCKLFRIGHHLEGGIVFEAASDKAVYIPARCLHAVYTGDGGFLFSLDFTTKPSIVPFGTYLSKRLYLTQDEEGQQSCFFAHVDSTEIVLFNGRHEEVIESWLALGPVFTQCCVSKQDMARISASVLGEILDRPGSGRSELSLWLQASFSWLQAALKRRPFTLLVRALKSQGLEISSVEPD
ncbi:hypothetical protein LTR09_012565 [Extremus antarcticus]|uniref:JmjC domain-containing protein n=1 Tax=Extremus antarcticus TaxID=702011 RepID=A0AAJ0D531_9PEZI|nr:hypothetical protein LTR09_012565 [Extremus antarcticus]